MKIILFLALLIFIGCGIDATVTRSPQNASVISPAVQSLHTPENQETAEDVIWQGAPMTKQRVFDNQEQFETPVRLPAEAWRQIVEAEENSAYKDTLLEENDPARWVYASKLDISRKGSADYIIMGRKIPLMGANLTQFYIILNSGENKYDIVFSAPAKALFMSDKRRNGYRDIDTAVVTVSKMIIRSYSFDGKHYVFKSETIEER